MDVRPFLKVMVERKASDLFITAGFPPSAKIDGELRPLAESAFTPAQSLDFVESVMTEAQKKEFHTTRECNFAFAVKELGRFRVSAFWQRESPGCVMRRIETKIPEVDDLKLPPILKDLVMSKRGLIIMVGGTGTGKSTSLAALVGYRNAHARGHNSTPAPSDCAPCRHREPLRRRSASGRPPGYRPGSSGNPGSPHVRSGQIRSWQRRLSRYIDSRLWLQRSCHGGKSKAVHGFCG